MYDVILIPTDGSEYAESAAETGIELAGVHDAAVHVVCVVETGPFGGLRLPGDAASAEEAIRDRANEFVARIADRANAEGLEVTTATPSGPPGSELLEYAEAVDADLIVMGTRGRGGFHRAALGSVADHVIRFGDVQVLVSKVKAPE
ncbi:universal stress protein [Natronobeatus ordinarius]|uniref:universal stress protein n=1 Tax=Natronobeatus ordinarius TaxID=2963433 RepID=UPI0020CC0EF9|nr:universal stress protein [Natronobeatus ordinarius]